ncbi:MAG: hypothetical protein M4579_003304 [Chaenotheca gracillima]|nr:MAG: hypothetical protein M4579_003304 [Chaenotheca gracillima]
MDQSSVLDCPFCAFTDHDSYIMMLHVETLHTEGDSPFVAQHSNSATHMGSSELPACYSGNSNVVDFASDSLQYVACPEPECGEEIPVGELDSHTELHQVEKDNNEDSELFTDQESSWSSEESTMHESQVETHFSTYLPEALRNRGMQSESSLTVPAASGKENARQKSDSGKRKSKALFQQGPSPRRARTEQEFSPKGGIKRLGKSELGPHANEKQMPGWLKRQLQAGGTVTVRNQIRLDGTLEKVTSISNEAFLCLPVLAQLCEQDTTVERAYFCHPGVRHIYKMKKEGGFCGYRNIQMLVSYIQEAESFGHEHFGPRTPNILDLQDMIESAWDLGFNSECRLETGGIKGTRKYIGTSEAQALFLSLGILCELSAIGRAEGSSTYERLLEIVEAYFVAASLDSSIKIHKTWLPPIYLQHSGHSLTIVGFERRKNGDSNLLVFDPVFGPSPAFRKLIGKSFRHRMPQDALKAYRRGKGYLGKYNAFELLQSVQPVPN